MFNKLIPLILLIGISCVEPGGSRSVSSTSANLKDDFNTGGGSKGSLPSEGGLDEEGDITPKVEITHIIEPRVDENSEGGTYLQKLTLPKNYNGLLYIAGINIGSLSNKNIKVRFHLGQTRDPITLDATVSTAAGLTPQTNVQVLILDMRDQPFRDVQLIYDLYDYNDYTFLGSSVANAKDEPVQDNRDSKLFCRGLNLEDDPTFTGSGSCSGASNICRYSYAKVVDQGLLKQITNPNGPGNLEVPLNPSEAQIQSGSASYYQDDIQTKLNRCLADTPDYNGTNYFHTFDFDGVSFTNLLLGSSALLGGESYFYEGPYRPINTNGWQISNAAVFSSNGLFNSSFSSMVGFDYTKGYNSKLFPLATKLEIPKDIEYWGSDNPVEKRSLQTQNVNGESKWMDGCNARATTMNQNTGESIGSCTVSASIEVISLEDDDTETIIASSKDVKLQLVKEAQVNASGDDVLYSSFKSCSSSNQCGSDACCFNSRCWSKALVSQCSEDSDVIGNKIPGQACSSDFECSSLCCNQSSGVCSVQDTTQDPPVYCSKNTGQFCIAKEWCAQKTIRECYIVKTGFTVTGVQTCALRCYTFQAFGDCERGVCRDPAQPPVPVFNPDDPNTCDQAIDPPNFDQNGTTLQESSF